MKDKQPSKKDASNRWNQDALTGKAASTTEEKSLDIVESGQFAPGGHYNQPTINQPRRRHIDDDIVPPGRH